MTIGRELMLFKRRKRPKWKGLLAEESRKTKVQILLAMLLISSAMSFLQLGIIGIGAENSYSVYILALIAPIGIVSLLLGKGWGSLEGLLAGSVIFLHARLQPLDMFEYSFTTILNSLVLYTITGFFMGCFFSIALHNDPKGIRRKVYMGIACYVSSFLLNMLFTIFALVDVVASTLMQSISTGVAAMSRDNALALMSLGSSTFQIVCGFALAFLVSVLSDVLVQQYYRSRHHASVRTTFRLRMVVSLFMAFLVVASASFAIITVQAEWNAYTHMTGEFEYLESQLTAASNSKKNIQETLNSEGLPSESVDRISNTITADDLLDGYDPRTDGTVVIFQNGMVYLSDSPTYPKGKSTTSVLGFTNANILEKLSKSGRMERMLYTNEPYDKLAIGDLTYEHASDNLDDSKSSQSVEVGHTVANAQLGYMRAIKSGTYYIMMAMPASMVFANRTATIWWTALSVFILLLVVYIHATVLLGRIIVTPIDETNTSLAKITAGNLDEVVDVRESVEFASLSDGINTTVGTLKGWIVEAETRMERELATAKAIQESALPRTFPPYPEIDAFDIYASMNAAKEVGGDFYDFFLIDDHTLGFLIADVSGKGIPGALFMMAAKTELENYMMTGMSLDQAVTGANRALCANNDAGMFVTVWAATLDWQTGDLTFVNAGHNYPLLRHGTGGTWEWIDKKCGLFLGTFETAKYRTATLKLEEGDELLLYTDGVNEAFNVDEEEYGNDRLEAYLGAHTNLHPHMLVQSLRNDVARWAEGAEQSDDITILALEFGTIPEATGSMTVKATIDNFGVINDMIQDELTRRMCPPSIAHKVEIALEEIFVNVCSYAYELQDEVGDVTVSYLYQGNPSTISIELRDHGVPFDPVTRLDPTKPETIQETPIGGLGIYMVKKIMDDLAYVYDDGHNVVAFCKRW